MLWGEGGWREGTGGVEKEEEGLEEGIWEKGDWREGMGGVGREGEGLVDEIGGEQRIGGRLMGRWSV